MVGDEHLLRARKLLAVSLRLLGERAHEEEDVFAHESSGAVPVSGSAQQLFDGVGAVLVERLIKRPEVVLLKQLLQLLEAGWSEEVVELRHARRLSR